jgi:hypothetical protein
MIFSLIICIPSFLRTLVRTIFTENDNINQDASPFITLLCDALDVGLQVGPTDELVDKDHDCRNLGLSVLKILEVMCYSLDKDDVSL